MWMAVIGFLRGLNPKMVMAVTGVILLVAAFFYVKHLGSVECKLKQAEANSKQQEQFNEISTHRPDTDTLIKRLLAGTF